MSQKTLLLGPLASLLASGSALANDSLNVRKKSNVNGDPSDVAILVMMSRFLRSLINDEF